MFNFVTISARFHSGIRFEGFMNIQLMQIEDGNWRQNPNTWSDFLYKEKNS